MRDGAGRCGTVRDGAGRSGMERGGAGRSGYHSTIGTMIAIAAPWWSLSFPRKTLIAALTSTSIGRLVGTAAVPRMTFSPLLEYAIAASPISDLPWLRGSTPTQTSAKRSPGSGTNLGFSLSASRSAESMYPSAVSSGIPRTSVSNSRCCFFG